MKQSLSSSVVLVLVTINVVVFGAAGAWLTGTLARSERLRVQGVLERRIQESIIGRGELRAGGILTWSGWDGFEDALVVRLPREEALAAPRSQLPRGVMLNPLGASRRGPDFDQAGVLASIRDAVAESRPVSSSGGVAIPVPDPEGETWGGCWMVPKSTWSLGRLLRILLPWFAVSTVLLVAGSYFALSRLVLSPVRQLAEGTGRLAGGDLSARLPEPRGGDELSRLVRAFNSMALEMQGFGQRLEDEVERATSQARHAEAVAMNQRRLAATGELAAGIAHEINNPLGGILNAVEALGREDLHPARRAEYLELVRGALERIRHTVGGVLRLAPRRTSTSAVDLAGPVADAIELVRHRAESEGVELLVARGAGEPVTALAQGASQHLAGGRAVEAEAGEVGQAVLNLLVNALDALRDGAPGALPGGRPEYGRSPRIVVRLDESGEEVVLSIEDNGPGMEPELLERACDPFFSTKDPGQGTGLGLAIASSMVNGIGGRLELSSEAGQWFRVDLHLPASRPKA